MTSGGSLRSPSPLDGPHSAEMLPGRQGRSATRNVAALQLVFVAVALLASCGADEDDAPLAPARPDCPRLQTHAAALTNALALGAGTELAAWLRSEPVRSSMSTLLGAVLGGPHLGEAYRDSTARVEAIPALADLAAPVNADRLEPLLMALASGDDAAAAGCSHLRAVATQCVDAASLVQLALWLDDPRLRAVAPSLLAIDGASVGAAASALGVPTQLGLQTLAAALLESAAHPEFQPDGLRALLVDAIATAGSSPDMQAGVPLLSALVVILDVATRGLDGAIDPARLAATRGLCACVVTADSDADAAADGALLKRLIGALWPAQSAAGAKTATVDVEGVPKVGADLAGGALQLLAGLLRTVAADPKALLAAQTLVTLAADADWLARAMPQAVDLWRRGALAAAIDAVAASLAAARGGPCASP